MHSISEFVSARFGKYIGIGLATFTVDISLLFFFTSILNIYYLWATIMAFICAATLNYTLSRMHVFKGTKRPIHSGYVISLLIAAVGLATIIGFMYLFVQVLHINYLVSRVLAAILVGMWGYLMNLYVNFKTP